MHRELERIQEHVERLEAICDEANRRHGSDRHFLSNHYNRDRECLILRARDSLRAIRESLEIIRIDGGDQHIETCRRMFAELTAVR